MSAVALLFIVSSAAAYSSLECDSPELRHSTKVDVAVCVAQCLDLDFQATKNCSYSSHTGKVIVKYENFQKDGCTKCVLDWKNFQMYKTTAGLFQLVTNQKCGKKIDYGIAIPTDSDLAGMSCGIIWPLERHWLPKDWDEVRCVIESLPEDVQRIGKLRLAAYRSSCSKEFFFCTTDTPRSLRKSFLFEELNNQTLAQNGTCAIFDFKIKNKKAVDVRLRAADCKEKAFNLCELEV
ncbi:Hypothetical predicted protein [Cloeon dipterum]|uniref:Uncharacterized protein n=1 Tax=Cloeon dipterum TaxID=197152 RepID=A0A8S1CR86_9INSE|nr:Hypothetical predicted protein [Cloeon dipterum]